MGLKRTHFRVWASEVKRFDPRGEALTMLRAVNPTRRLGWLIVVAVALSWASCGGASVDGSITPTGGEVCLPENKVCIDVPIGALETQELLRISPGGETPGGALSDGYDISAVGKESLTFLKPATVRISLDAVRTDGLENLNLLRIYTRQDGEWQPLGKSFVDRVKNQVMGETTHLSPFVVLRSDRLPDGGLPIEIDAGPIDGSVIIVPPFDAGRPDAGRPDAGTPDAGRPDSGMPDAGPSDAGPADAGSPDAGPADAGTPDAGPADAGAPDAGPADAGAPDAGPPDAGPPDAGEPDAGEPDAGAPDAGDDAGVDAG